jgi:hypothetical protein
MGVLHPSSKVCFQQDYYNILTNKPITTCRLLLAHHTPTSTPPPRQPPASKTSLRARFRGWLLFGNTTTTTAPSTLGNKLRALVFEGGARWQQHHQQHQPFHPRKRAVGARFQGWLLFGNTTTTPFHSRKRAACARFRVWLLLATPPLPPLKTSRRR